MHGKIREAEQVLTSNAGQIADRNGMSHPVTAAGARFPNVLVIS